MINKRVPGMQAVPWPVRKRLRTRIAAVIVMCALVMPVGAVVGGPMPASASTTTQTVPGTGDLYRVACPSATSCEVVGENPSASQGVVVPVANGIPGIAQAVAGTNNFVGVACASTTTCFATGGSSSGSQGVMVPITDGILGSVRVVAGTQSLKGVACPGATCEAVGTNPPGPPGSARGVVVPIFNGTPGSVQAVPGTVILFGVACPSVTTCETVGRDPTGQGAVATVTIQTLVSLTFDNGAISQYSLGSGRPERLPVLGAKRRAIWWRSSRYGVQHHRGHGRRGGRVLTAPEMMAQQVTTTAVTG